MTTTFFNFFNYTQYILYYTDTNIDFVEYKEEYYKRDNVKLISVRKNIPHKKLNDYWNNSNTLLPFNYNKIFIRRLLNISEVSYDISNQEVADILDSERKNLS